MSNTLAVEKIQEVGLEAIIEMLYDGCMMADVALKLGVSRAALSEWMSHGDRLARVMAARADAAEQWDLKAERALIAANDKDEIAKARELAHHYRWRAAKLAPKSYGDKVMQEHSGPGGAPIQVVTGVPNDPQFHNQPAALPSPALLDTPKTVSDWAPTVGADSETRP